MLRHFTRKRLRQAVLSPHSMACVCVCTGIRCVLMRLGWRALCALSLSMVMAESRVPPQPMLGFAARALTDADSRPGRGS